MKRFIILLLICICSCNVLGGSLDKFFPHLLNAEGRIFTITQYDFGGATKFGVAWKTFLIACKQSIAKDCDKNKDAKLTPKDLALTTQLDAKVIYDEMYWKQYKGHLIENQAIAEIIIDLFINSGTGRGNKHVKAIQGFVGAKQDGKIGANTIRLINQADAKKLYGKIYQYRYNYYKAIGKGTQKKFLKGWLNRIKNLKAIHENEKYI
ncbi:MAG: glycosyl hydrolase 108 family protein [Flectobacillus sp.]|uniref:glycosyl hydrolase 108 family protein n=1 Tax=Flectobacillus sp. TaxID=50419 RepID=UPI003B9C6BED